MAYLHPSSGDPLPQDVIGVLGRALGLAIPEEDVGPLSIALRDQLASIDRIERLDLSGVTRPSPFDPRWHE